MIDVPEGYFRSVTRRAHEFRRRLGWEENHENKKAAVWQIMQEDTWKRIAARSFGCFWASDSEGGSTDSEEDSTDSEEDSSDSEESGSSDSESECGSESSSDSASSSSASDADLQLSTLVAKKRMSDSEWNKLLAFATHALHMLMNLVIYKELCLHAYLGHVVEKFLVECGNIFVGRQPFGDPRANGVFELVGGLRTEMGRIRRLFLFVCIFSGKFLVVSVF